MYTKHYMNQFMNNRYVQLAGLILGIGVIFYIIVRIAFGALNADVPGFVPFIMAFGASGWLVWKFLAYKIG